MDYNASFKNELTTRFENKLFKIKIIAYRHIITGNTNYEFRAKLHRFKFADPERGTMGPDPPPPPEKSQKYRVY